MESFIDKSYSLSLFGAIKLKVLDRGRLFVSKICALASASFNNFFVSFDELLRPLLIFWDDCDTFSTIVSNLFFPIPSTDLLRFEMLEIMP